MSALCDCQQCKTRKLHCYTTIRRHHQYRIIQQFSIDTPAVSQDPSFDEKSFPRAVKQPVSPTVTCHSHYSVMEHFNAHHALVKPTEGVFDYYIRIDTGEGIDDDWPIQLKHPASVM